MFTESVLSSREVHHHFIPEKDNETEIKALEVLLRAYDRFELDGRSHTRRFTLSKTTMLRRNVELSAPQDGNTWRILTGKLTMVPEASDRVAAIGCCKRFYDRGIETFMMERVAKTSEHENLLMEALHSDPRIGPTLSGRYDHITGASYALHDLPSMRAECQVERESERILQNIQDYALEMSNCRGNISRYARLSRELTQYIDSMHSDKSSNLFAYANRLMELCSSITLE